MLLPILLCRRECPLLHIFSCVPSPACLRLHIICICSPAYPLLRIILSCSAYHLFLLCIHPFLYLELYTYSCVKCSCLSCCAYSLLYLWLRRMQRFYGKKHFAMLSGKKKKTLTLLHHLEARQRSIDTAARSREHDGERSSLQPRQSETNHNALQAM